ncbi:Stage III sporulation protein D [compost metagenome]
MKDMSIEERATALARYILETKDTVRGTAKKFGISKSTVHKDVTKVEILKISSSIVLSRVSTFSPIGKVWLSVRF